VGFVTKDSGKRAQFKSGAVRDTAEGKGRFDLIPWVAMRRVAQLYQRGAEKYADRNWEKGIEQSRMLDSLIRHSGDYAMGERSEDHAAAIVFNALGLIFNEEMVARGLRPASLLDLPSYQPTPKLSKRKRRSKKR
jgi:hypothetical protein